MDNPVAALWDQTRGFWGSTTRQQKLQLVTITVVGIFTLAALLLFAFRVDYAPMISNIPAAEAGEIKAYLEGRGIPVSTNRQPDGKYTVLVPRSQVDSLMVDVSSEGLVKEGTDILSVLADSSMFMSEAERNIRIQEGLVGKLEAAFKTIEGVQNATVILNITRTPQTYGAPAAESTAAIILTLRSGYTLSEDRVLGVVNLAARSVPNLSTKNITLTDQSGTPLYDPDNTLGLGSASKIYDLESTLAQDFRRRLVADLGSILGYDNVRALVSVQLNTDSATETIRTLTSPDPDNPALGVILSEEHAGSNAGMDAASGIPGTTPDVPNVAPIAQAAAGQNGTYWWDVINYDYNETYREQVMGPGSSRAVTATIAINSRKLPTDDAYLQRIASMARGYLGNSASITVVPIDFVDLVDESALAAAEQQVFIRNLAFAAVAAVALIALLIFAWRYVAARNRRLAEEEAEMARQLAMQQEVRLPDSQISVQDKQRMQILEELNRLALNKPEEFAKLVMTWMEEG